MAPSARTIAVLLLALAAGPAVAEPAQPKRVEARPLAARELAERPRDGRFLLLRTAVFDPVTEAPDFAAVDLPAVPDAPDYGLVQFQPGRLDEKERLATLGVTFFGYLPDNAFQVLLTARTLALLENNPAVRWRGLWSPGFKVHPRLRPGVPDAAAEIDVFLFPGVSAGEVSNSLAARVPGAFLTLVREDALSPRLRFAVPRSVRRDFVREAAAIPGTAWLEPHQPRELHNNDSIAPVQSNKDGNVAGGACTNCGLFAQGLTGTGQIVAVLDSGCDTDMCFFRKSAAAGDVTDAENTVPPAVGTLWPAKKVIAYWIQPGSTAYDSDTECPDNGPFGYHGTHTTGTAVGDDYHTPATSSFPGIDVGDGMAPGAQLLFQDFGNDQTGCLVETDDYALYLQAMTGGARVHSNSTGSSTAGAYGSSDQIVDRFLFDHEQMAIFFSSGNSGPGSGSTGSPANSKNAVAVGAVGHGNSSTVASFSSRGPTDDGRIKPDLVAPGQSIQSAAGDADHGTNNCSTKGLSGTSMACPAAAGAAALLRQYFADGFYPTGVRNAADRFNPSAPLVKAVLLNGTLPLGSDPGFGNNAFGWGRVFLDNNLYFAGDARKLRVWNLPNTQGLKTGEAHRYVVTVGAGQEFRATLAWSDAEGTLGAATTLVNDLDLVATDGTNTWLGNVLATSGEAALGGSPDRVNTVEQVKLSAPSAGTYVLTITAARTPGSGRSDTDRQGYALAVSLPACASKVTAAPTGLVATSHPVMGTNLAFAPAPNATTTQVYRATGGCGAGIAAFQYIGQSSGGTFTDGRAQGGVTYSYVLRGADGCGEGPAGSCVTITPTGRCDKAPSFAGLASAAAVGTDCRIRLSWPAATSSCVNGQALHYNVYRSEAASPSIPGTRVGTTTGLAFEDTSVVSGKAYVYVVRAEDSNTGGNGPSGGNEESNSVSIMVAASGPPGAVGAWSDDGGDGGGLMSGDAPWRITATQAGAGQLSYHPGPDAGNYPFLTCAALTTPPLTLAAGAVLSYSVRYNLEYQWDGVVVEISTDGGGTWTDLPPTSPAGYPDTLAETTDNPVNACRYPKTHGAFTGPINNTGLTPWAQYQTNLSPAHDGKTVQVRWRFTSDPGLEFEGFYLDAISITNVRVPGPCTPVTNHPPTARISTPAADLGTEAGVGVSFAGTGSDPDPGDTLTYRWDFGDGTPVHAGQNPPAHPFAVPGAYTVTLTVTDSRGASTAATRRVTVATPAVSGASLFVPVVLDTDGSGGSHYVSEMTLASRAAASVEVLLSYTGTTGGGSGFARLTLAPGEQRVVPGVVSYLRSRGLPLTNDGSAKVGTLVATFSGVASARDVFAGTRTYTKDPAGGTGTFGLFYPASPLANASVVVFGLQQNASQRSNLSVQSGGSGTVTLRVEVLGPAGETLDAFDVALGPYGWYQKNQPLSGKGVTHGRARVTRISGTSPFAAYGVLNDVATSDGSFLTPLVPGDTSASERLVPIVLTASGYSSELTLANLTAAPLALTLTYTAAPQPGFSPDGTGSAPLTLAAGEQRIAPDALGFLRSLGIPVPSGINAGGSLLVEGPSGATADALAAGARTFTAGPSGGSFGVFYAGLSRTDTAGAVAYVYGLQQNDRLRSNFAAVNRGDAGDDVTLRITFYDATGHALANPETRTLSPGVWFQLNQPLSSRGADAGYAKIERISGASRFLAYGVLNDQVNSDGSYVSMSVP